MNIDDLVAIDIQTHAETSTRALPDEADAEALEAWPLPEMGAEEKFAFAQRRSSALRPRSRGAA